MLISLEVAGGELGTVRRVYSGMKEYHNIVWSGTSRSASKGHQEADL